MKLTNKKTNRKGFTLVELLVVMAIIAVLASVATPVIFGKLRDADRNKAIQHLKQVGLALIDFRTDEEYGIRPGQQIVDDNVIEGAAAGTSNDIFRQLFQSRKLDSEAIFQVKSQVSKKPDGDIGVSPAYSRALEKRECPFLYVDNPYSRSGSPVAACPLTQNNEFDIEVYNGKAVVLNDDGSVITPNIDERDKKVKIKLGSNKVDLFSDASRKFPNTGIRLVYPLK